MSVIGDALKQAERDANLRHRERDHAGDLRDKPSVALADRLVVTEAREPSPRSGRPLENVNDRPRSRFLLDWVAILIAAAAFVAAAVTINGGGAVMPAAPAASAQMPADLELAVLAGKIEPQGPPEGVPATVVSLAGPAQPEPATPAPGAALAAPKNATADALEREGHRSSPIDTDRFRVHGVLLGAGPPLAVINGVTLGVGQHVDGAEVVSIGRSRVRLRVDATEFEVAIRTRSGES